MHPAMMKLPSWSAPAFARGAPGHALLADLDEELYHGTPSIVSKSALSLLTSKSAFHFLNHLENPIRLDEAGEPVADPEVFRFGGAYHVAVLEPDLYDRKVMVMPDFGPFTKPANRQLRDLWIEEDAKGKIWLTPLQHRHVMGMRDALYKFKWARDLLRKGGRPEVTALWTCNETGLRCKSRADWLHAENGLFVDLKSARSAAPEAWRYAAKRMSYDMQDAMYSRAFEENNIHIDNFIFLVQEKVPPYAPASYQLSDDDRLDGENKYMGGLRKLRQCIDTNEWPSYTNGVADLRLPKIYTGLTEDIAA